MGGLYQFVSFQGDVSSFQVWGSIILYDRVIYFELKILICRKYFENRRLH